MWLDRTLTESQERANYIVDADNQKWQVGPAGIRLEDLLLLGLRKVSKAGVQPVLAYRRAAVTEGADPAN